ncbi:very short patch repair endonuclease [Pseudomonas sp. PK-RTE-24]
MVDVVDAATRSRMMSGIKGKNTRPEVSIRKALHARGFRYRIHANNLPGKPDLVLPKYKAVVFVHGCFWHGHSCKYFKVPKTRANFWLDKIGKNQIRDSLQVALLIEQGWRVAVVWECAVKNNKNGRSNLLIDSVADWLLSDSGYSEFDENSVFEL